jgi:flagellar hook-basal body complex protein FliE
MDILPLVSGTAASISTGMSGSAGIAVPSPQPAGDAGSGSVFERMLDAVDGAAGAANDATARMVNGTGDVHEAMIALQQADLALQFAVQIRNKLVQAYQEISRMPV